MKKINRRGFFAMIGAGMAAVVCGVTTGKQVNEVFVNPLLEKQAELLRDYGHRYAAMSGHYNNLGFVAGLMPKEKQP